MEARERAVEALVVANLDRTVIVSPSDNISGAAAFGGAKFGGRGVFGTGSTALAMLEALAFKRRHGAGNYNLVIANASKVKEEAWNVLRTAMPVSGLIIVADDLSDVPADIREICFVVNGLCPEDVPDVQPPSPNRL